MSKLLDPITTAFRDKDTEKAFQAASFASNCRVNTIALFLFASLFGLYAFVDLALLEDARFAVIIRTTATAAGLVALIMMHVIDRKQHHEIVTVLIVLTWGLAVCLIIRNESDLDNTYYVAFIQGAVFLCFLVRVGFVKPIAVMALFLAGFAWAVQGKADVEQAMTQILVLVTMFFICGFGCYLLQRYRRDDFMKTATIEQQNSKLQVLLEDAKLDNARKLAAMNMLVHFIKTPLHQIAGFSDILVQSATNAEAGDAAENARYIQNATTSLTKSVSGLLAYHRLDEAESRAAPETTELSCAIEDFRELLPSGVESSSRIHDEAVVFVDLDVLRAALKSFAEYCADPKNDVSRLTISLEPAEGAWDLQLRDDAHILSPSQFDDLIQPLTKIETYLGHTGDEMPMTLRTVARAIDIIGGEFSHLALSDGNRFNIKLPAHDARAAAA